MAVQSDTSRISYAGNNSTSTSYAVPFVFLENTHLKAIAKTSAGVESVVTLTNHAGAGNVNGGTVRTAVAVPATSTLTIYRDVPITQTTTYAEGGDFPAASHERALDKLTTITQQLDRRINTCVRGSEATPLSPLPSPIGTQQFVLATTANQAPAWQPQSAIAIGPVIATGSSEPRFVSDRFADTVNVKDFGAVGDGVTDDTAAINAALNFARPLARAVYVPSGVYLVTGSLNFTGANNTNHPSDPNLRSGWTMYGDGIETSIIHARLSAAYPVLDRTGSHASVLRNLSIRGLSTGLQTCGVLDAEALINGVQGRSRECLIDGVMIDGIYSQAAYINFNSDLSYLQRCYFNGPAACIYTGSLGGPFTGLVQSAFQTIGTNVNVTMHNIGMSYLAAEGGDPFNFDAVVVSYEVYQIHIDHTYIAQTQNALYGIYYINDASVAGTGGTMSYTDGRYENQSTNAGTFLCVDMQDGGALTGSVITGFLGNRVDAPVNGAGQVIYLKNGDIEGMECRVELAGSWSNPNAKFISRSPTGGVIRQSHLVDTSGQTTGNSLMEGRGADCVGDGNIIQLRGWNNAWTQSANNNLFVARDGIYNWSNRPFYRIGETATFARGFAGCADTGWGDVATTGTGSDENLLDYTLAGNIANANTVQNRVALKLSCSGVFAANGNTKSLKAKFGTLGNETTLVTNDITTAPNGTSWIIEVELLRADNAQWWTYHAKMFVGSALQSVKMQTLLSAFPAIGGVGKTVTISNASPAVITCTNHGYENLMAVIFSTTGALPTGLTAGTVYYVRNKTANAFEVSTTPTGSVVNTSSAGSGVHTSTVQGLKLLVTGNAVAADITKGNHTIGIY
jgi:hypothetical protein